jgi:cytochrome d ubiquinol oxidase subunit II
MLQVMFWSVPIFVPIILLYTGWVYRVMRGKVTEQHVRGGGPFMY